MEGTETAVCAGLRVLVLSPTPSHPQDYGNRKRIFQICDRFKKSGAHITFVHYPAESEWRKILPAGADRAMRQCWDQYHVIGPTRPLHTNPAKQHHNIDEWYDHAISQFLRWLFSVQSFDIFIVNYSWLSKAFEFAPPQVFKILDTHDKVSGRHEMLAALGIGPEFFYTTEEQEAVALGRADLVWAIKEQEQEQFARMTPTPVLTMPHLDPMRTVARRPHDAGEYLKVGIIGARNNVNRINITEFLQTALPVIERSFAPVRIVIAGTVCALLEGIDSPLVQLAGPVGQVEDFYKSVDCVVVPMRASTGLKIKAGEALSLGLPLISLAHAFEGYEPADSLHTLATFEDMANALVEISFGQSDRLDILAKASATSHAATEKKIVLCFSKTFSLARDKAHSIVVAVDARAFVPGSIFALVLNSLYEDLRQLGNLTVLVARGSMSDIAGNPQSIDLFDRVVVAREVAGTDRLHEALAEAAVDIVDVEKWLGHMQPKILLIDALHPAFQTVVLPETVVVSRAELIALSQRSSDFCVPGKSYKRAFVAAPAVSPEIVALAAPAGAGPLPTPVFRRAPPVKVRSAHLVNGRKTLAILGPPGSHAVTMAADMARAWGLEPFVVCGFDDLETAMPEATAPPVRADEYVTALYARDVPSPHFSIDLSGGGFGLALCREVLERLRVPVVSGSSIGGHRSLRTAFSLKVGSEQELWTVMRAFATETDAEREELFHRGWNDLEWGRGWAWFWRYSKKLFETVRETSV